MRTLPFLLILAACGADAPTELEGSVYSLSFADVEVVGADPGASDLVKNAVSGDILMQAFAADDASISWRLAFGNEDGQDACSRTTDLPSADRDGNSFSIGPAAVTFPATPPWTMEGLSIDGTLSADLGSASDISIQGTLDTREIVDQVPLFNSGEAICQAFGSFGLTCTDCGDGEFCVDIEATGLSGTRVVVDVESITEDPNCE